MLSISDVINSTIYPVMESEATVVGDHLKCGVGLKALIGNSKRDKILLTMCGRMTAWNNMRRQDALFKKQDSYHEWEVNNDNTCMILQNRRNIVIQNEMNLRAHTIGAIMDVLNRTFIDMEDSPTLKISRNLNDNPNAVRFCNELFSLPTEYRLDILGGKPNGHAEIDVFGMFQEACKAFCKNLLNIDLPLVDYIDADGTENDFGMYIVLKPGAEFIKAANSVGHKDPSYYIN